MTAVHAQYTTNGGGLQAGTANELPLAEAALWYASRGIPVFPCRPRGKEPLVAGGFHAATANASMIKEWWRRWPEANIGVPTGSMSGWLILDVDPRHGGDCTVEQWVARYGRWPTTAEAVTGGGGRHIVFQHVPGLRCGPVDTGVDLKTDGGYVIVAPSIHPSGKAYTWDGLDGAEALFRLSEPPGWLLRLARERRRQTVAATVPGRKICAGRRNVKLTSIAGVLRSHGAGEAELRELLTTINARLCDPPLSRDEVERIAQSVSCYEPRAESGRLDAKRFFERVEDGRYRMLIPGVAGELEVDMLRREEGALVGELTARCNLPGNHGVDGVLSIADFNLSSARARVERAKLIASRATTPAGEVDWLNIIEDLCQRVLLAERDGEPAVRLPDVEEPTEDDLWLIAGVPLLKNHPAILFGDGGSGKSYLGLWLAMQLVRSGIPTLLADWELDEREHRRRLGLLGGLDCRGLFYMRCSNPLTVECERIRRVVREFGIQYLMIDSVALACDGPPESAEVAGRYFRALRRVGIGSLNIAHVSKSENADQKPFGSAFWHNCARATFFVKRAEQVGGERTVQVGLFQRKSNLGPLRAPWGFEISFESGATKIRRIDISGQPEFAGQLSVAQRLYALLRSGPRAPAELAEELGTTDSTIRSILTRKRGVFVRLPDGRIALASHSEAADERPN